MNRKQPSKNTHCQATMTITLKKSVCKGRLSRNKNDSHLPDFPTAVNLKHIHNHRINCADALRHLDVSQETRDKLVSLFHKKHSPTTGLDEIKYDLQIEHGEKYHIWWQLIDQCVLICSPIMSSHER